MTEEIKNPPSEAPNGVFHGMPSSTITVDMLNAAKGKTVMTQNEKVHSTLQTAISTVMQGQGKFNIFELYPIESKSQHQIGVSLYHQKRYEEVEAMFQQALQGREKTLGHDHKDTDK
ncbi:Tetratricopeptide-like helical, partial [Penicillium hordei]